MRIKTKEYVLYTIHELPEGVRNKAKELYFEEGIDYEWWDCTYSWIKDISCAFGLNIDEIYFSGFGGQGDGACFTGNYKYKDNWKEVFENDFELTEQEPFHIAEELEKIQGQCNNNISAAIAQRGHYYHEFSTEIFVQHDNEYLDKDYINCKVIGLLRDYMRWIYDVLQKEYEYLMSTEYFIELCDANHFEFDEHGKLSD